MQSLTGYHWEFNWTPGRFLERTITVRWKNTVSSGLSVVVDTNDNNFLSAADVYAWEYTSIPGYTVTPPTHAFTNPRFSEFIRYTAYCLDLLYLTPSGKALLDLIYRQSQKVAITPTGIGGNQYRIQNHQGYCLLKQDFNDQKKRDKLILFLAAQRFKKDGIESIRNLYEYLSSHWRYFSNHGIWPNDKDKTEWTSVDARELKTKGKAYVKCMNQITWEEFTGWLMLGNNTLIQNLITRTNSGPIVTAQTLLEVLKDNIIVFFYPQSPSGTPGDIMIDFNTILWNEHNEMTRPLAVGLGHELVHSWFAIQGKQPDASGTDIVLTEMACVGLGPWLRHSISDNQIRAQWAPPAIPRQTKEVNRPKDIFNIHCHTIPRHYYAWDESAMIKKDQALKREYPFGMMSCCLCQKPRGKTISRKDNKWHRCQGCKRIYCDTCGYDLSYPGLLPRSTRKCSKCRKETQLIT